MKCHNKMKLAIITIFIVTHSRAKIMRNNALMTRMMSHFQKDNIENNVSVDPEPPPKDSENPSKVLSLMQNVLCRNFPTIPCKMIMRDDTLKNLIEESIQQLTYKKLKLEHTTPLPNFGLTLFPIINSDDLSNFLQVSNNGYYTRKRKDGKKKSSNEPKTLKNFWSHEKLPKNKLKLSKDGKHNEIYSGRKKMRKFYPHKIKYKDKNVGNHQRTDFRGEYSEEKLSMSVELPDMQRNQRMSYNVEPAEPPVWRIDYMKHGEPSLNMFAYQDERLRGKIMKTGPSVIVDENVLEQAARKDVLHPDVYIKKNYVRKNTVNMNSEGSD